MLSAAFLAVIAATATLLTAFAGIGLWLFKQLCTIKPQIDKYVNDIQVLDEDLDSDEKNLSTLFEKYPKDANLIELLSSNGKHKKVTSEMQDFGVLLQKMIKEGEEKYAENQKILSQTRTKLMENPEIMEEIEKIKDL